MSKNVTSEYKGFLTCMDYFATGEGRTIELNFCYCDTKEEAKEKHLDRFIGKDPKDLAARNYFGVGVEVMKIESKKAKEVLMDMFKHGEGTWNALRKGGVEFHYKFYFNFS